MRFAWIVLGVVSLACTAEDPPSSAAGPVPLEDFCDVLVGDTCRWQAACGCDPVASRCDEQLVGCGNLVAGVQRLIDAGSTMYDGMAVRRLADRLAASTCDDKPLAAWGYQARDLLDWGGAFRGRLPVGSACSVQSLTPGDDTGDPLGASIECADGLCIDNRCVELRGVGEPCDATVRCFDFSVGAWDDDDEMRPACSGTCQPLKSPGAACTDNPECLTYRCDGVCLNAGGTGAACASGSECESFACDPASGCGAGDLPAGATCASAFECDSDACEAGVCVAAACSPYPR